MITHTLSLSLSHTHTHTKQIVHKLEDMCMHVRIYSCMYPCMYVFMLEDICIHVCMYACMYACMHVLMLDAFMHASIFIYFLVRIYVCKHICIRLYLWGGYGQ